VGQQKKTDSYCKELRTSPFSMMRDELKYKENGDTMSNAHATVTKKDAVKYVRVMGGISMYQSRGSTAAMAALLCGRAKRRLPD
jgi:hypothetical protein